MYALAALPALEALTLRSCERLRDIHVETFEVGPGLGSVTLYSPRLCTDYKFDVLRLVPIVVNILYVRCNILCEFGSF